MHLFIISGQKVVCGMIWEKERRIGGFLFPLEIPNFLVKVG